MGIPAVGKSIFLFPLRSSDKFNKKANNAHIYLHKCKGLHLSLVLPRVVSDTSNKGLSISGSLLESASVISEKGVDLSPKTPIAQPKLSSPGATPVHSRKPYDSIARTGSSMSSDVSSVRLALADEKANKLLQASVTRWLYGRYLLCGNIVTVPLILGHICAFLVESSDNFLTDCNNQDLMHEENQDLLSREIQVCTSWEKSGVAFLLDTKTNILLSDPMSLVRENSSKRGVLKEDLTCKTISEMDAFDRPKLGGLSKEFAALKEIIMFSLANKGHLPRYKGVLLHGPPGTGKTSLAAACAHDAGASLFSINGPEIISQYYGESEQALHDVFESARRAAPAVVTILSLAVSKYILKIR